MFHQAMFLIYERAKDECGYIATRFREMVEENGGLEAAKKLLQKPLSEGFISLWERGRVDLTMEALILQPKWKVLFTDEELKIARIRLQDAGYTPPE